MNYRGNAFSAGKGKISDAKVVDGKIHFLQLTGGSYSHRVFDPDGKSFATEQSEVSFADSCWFYGGLLQLFGAVFKRKDE